MRWFQRKYVSELSYNALALQLNGYATISEKVRKAVNDYLSEK